MPIKYSEAQTIDAISKALEEPLSVYNSGCCNWRGKPNDSDRYYTDIIAEKILSQYDSWVDFLERSKIKRENTANVSRSNSKPSNEQSNRIEEQIAKKMYGQTWYGIGEVKGFQVPLKDKLDAQNKGRGKIDLLSVTEDGDIAIIELKRPGSRETLLRCALEIETYYRISDHSQLGKDFGISSNTIKKVILIEKGSSPNNDLKTDQRWVLELINKAGISVLVYEVNPEINELISIEDA